MSSVSCGTRHVCQHRRDESGEGRLKFIVVLAVLAIVGYCLYQYVPVAVQAYQYKDVMQQTVNTAAMQAQTTPDSLRKALMDSGKDYGAPPNMQVDVSIQDGRWLARVRYNRDVSLPFYTYQYSFDHTVKSFNPLTLR